MWFLVAVTVIFSIVNGILSFFLFQSYWVSLGILLIQILTGLALVLMETKATANVKKYFVYSSIGFGAGILLSYFVANFGSLLYVEMLSFNIQWMVIAGLFLIFLSTVAGFFYASIKDHTFRGELAEVQEKPVSSEKILDSSVIIDGRILKIAKTNFIEGPFIIPNFVLREIQLISDSADPIKRNRGRRGLDLLNELQQLSNIKVKISYKDYPNIRDVDSKLIQLARDTGGKLITNDFNLEKVAEVHGVQVLNLNALSEALRPIVLPGEELKIQIIKEGKDENQGVGYLDDGTMVVIEEGKELIGKLVRVQVTSIIQTAAGKMIFTKAIAPVVEEEEEANIDKDSKTRKVSRDTFIRKPKLR